MAIKLLDLLKEDFEGVIKGDKVKGSGDVDPDITIKLSAEGDGYWITQDLGNGKIQKILIGKGQMKKLISKVSDSLINAKPKPKFTGGELSNSADKHKAASTKAAQTRKNNELERFATKKAAEQLGLSPKEQLAITLRGYEGPKGDEWHRLTQKIFRKLKNVNTSTGFSIN